MDVDLEGMSSPWLGVARRVARLGRGVLVSSSGQSARERRGLEASALRDPWAKGGRSRKEQIVVRDGPLAGPGREGHQRG